MKKRLSVLVVCLVLVLSVSADAEDRYDHIFDSSQDAGRLTARFLKLTAREGDTKSGDCTILTSPDGKVMLIDVGNETCFIDIDNALTALGVARIDYLVVSHPHGDHTGSILAVIDKDEIGAMYTSELEYRDPDDDTYARALEVLAADQVPHIIVADGDSFWFGDSVLVEVLHPAPGIEYYDGYPANSTAFVNNHSLVLKITFGESSFLFVGDLYSDGEEEVIERHGNKLDVDVLKVGHHGAYSSSSRAFRDAVSAEIAVIMYDAIPPVYQKFVRDGTDTYVTSIHGSVQVSASGDGQYTVVKESGL